MTTLGLVLLIYALVSLAYWAYCLYGTVRAGGLPALSSLAAPDPPAWPRLSIVIPACNEADKVAEASGTILAEDYPDIEVILVDDRSTDRTGEVIDRLADSDRRVKAIHLASLPAGWLGKVHALDRGYRESSGEYVLFTDADVHYKRGTLRRAVACMRARDLGHLAAIPDIWPAGFLVDASICMFLRSFVAMVRPWRVADPRSKAFMGVGAFNLVRRSAFERTPGFEWLRMEVADDFGLGMMMKRSGARSGVVTAFDSIGLHWYRSVREMARGAEKGVAALDCRPWRAIIAAPVVLAVGLSPILTLLPLIRPGLRPVGGVGVAVAAAYIWSSLALARWAHRRVLPCLAGPVAAVVAAAILVASGVAVGRMGGVRWRGTFYDCKALREGRRVRIRPL